MSVPFLWRKTMIQNILPFLQVILAFGNICIIMYGFAKFLGKPHNNLDSRVTTLEIKQKDIEASLKQGNDRFREQVDTNAMFKSVMLAFVDFEIAYCMHTNYEHTEDLMRAKKALQDYLARK